MRSLTDQLRRLQPGPHADNTTPMMSMRSKTPLYGRRFVYGYSLDGSDFPCYLVWPWRTDSNSFFLLESQSRRCVALDQAGFLHPLGLRHFYDGFRLRAEISIRSAALDLHEDELSSDLIVSQAAVVDSCENHARKMRTFFTRRLEPKTKSSNAFKWSLRPKRK